MVSFSHGRTINRFLKKKKKKKKKKQKQKKLKSF